MKKIKFGGPATQTAPVRSRLSSAAQIIESWSTPFLQGAEFKSVIAFIKEDRTTSKIFFSQVSRGCSKSTKRKKKDDFGYINLLMNQRSTRQELVREKAHLNWKPKNNSHKIHPFKNSVFPSWTPKSREKLGEKTTIYWILIQMKIKFCAGKMQQCQVLALRLATCTKPNDSQVKNWSKRKARKRLIS